MTLLTKIHDQPSFPPTPDMKEIPNANKPENAPEKSIQDHNYEGFERPDPYLQQQRLPRIFRHGTVACREGTTWRYFITDITFNVLAA